MNNLPYFLALNRIPTIGPRTVAKLLKKWPNLQHLFELSELDLEQAGLPKPLAQAIKSIDWKLVDTDLHWMSQPNQYLLTWESEQYPALLKEIHDPPIVLYAKGNLNAFQNTRLAIVGTRKPSISGSDNAKYFAKALSAHSVTIVSGLALGIDAQAHLGCLEAKGSTIAVMGTGIDCIYPKRHLALATDLQQNGLLLSEFPLGSLPIAGHFPRRNRIISGLSLATLVIEAAVRSGSLITARFAMEQNRDVLAIPSSIHNPQARGCHLLLQQGAKLVTSLSDVLEELGLQQTRVTKHGKTSVPEKPFEGIDTLRKKPIPTIQRKGMLDCIGYETTTIDEIVVRSQYNIEEVMCALAELQLQGLIIDVPGGYIRC
jgi:DNA processing protein